MAGPTGAGKTALALALAERLDAEIVGADAFQIYEGLPILTAHPSAEERCRVPHHLIGGVPIGDSFDAQQYAREARSVLDGIVSRGRAAIVVGGTGLYFRALIDGFAPTPAIDPALRVELEAMDLPALVERLAVADALAPLQVDLKNKRRVTRAIEIVETSGRPLGDFRATPRTDADGILLVRERQELKDRIEANVRGMFVSGVVEEVRRVADSVGPTAARAIGLREILQLLRGEISEVECAATMVISTRQYAKRQLTWFRNQTRFSTLDSTGTQIPAVERALRALGLE